VNAQAGDVIWVKQGTYVPATPFAGVGRARSFELQSGVRVLGAFPSTGSPDPGDRNGPLHPTVLSGLLVPTDPAQSAFHVVTAFQVGDQAVLDGFVIRDGRADGDGGFSDPVGSDYGGGFLAFPNTLAEATNEPRIQNCVFTDNWAIWGGGAASIGDGGFGEVVDPRPSFRACEFVGNEAQASGGGAATHVAAAEFVSCLVHENFSGQGGGLSGLRDSTTTVVASTITANACTDAQGGGGIRVLGSSFGAQSTLVMTSSIVVGNTDTGSPEEFNDQIRGGGPLGISGLTIEYSCVSDIDLLTFGVGNIDSDPDFVDPSIGNYRLGLASPCIDAGDTVAVPADDSDVDSDGDFVEPIPDGDRRSRVQNVVLDMGAFERRCLGDLDSDGDVDASDLAVFIGFWGQPCWACPADMNDDGIVDASDLPFLLGGWGSCEAQFPPPMLLMMSESSSTSGGATPGDLTELFGFPSVEACVAWLSTLPPAVVTEILELVFGPVVPVGGGA
jgi:hypothetical protein